MIPTNRRQGSKGSAFCFRTTRRGVSGQNWTGIRWELLGALYWRPSWHTIGHSEILRSQLEKWMNISSAWIGIAEPLLLAATMREACNFKNWTPCNITRYRSDPIGGIGSIMDFWHLVTIPSGSHYQLSGLVSKAQVQSREKPSRGRFGSRNGPLTTPKKSKTLGTHWGHAIYCIYLSIWIDIVATSHRYLTT